MGRILLTLVALGAIHGGAGTLQPRQAAPAGFGAYVQGIVAQGSASTSGTAYGIVTFGESVPRPASASVQIGW